MIGFIIKRIRSNYNVAGVRKSIANFKLMKAAKSSNALNFSLIGKMTLIKQQD
jgi:hypothetical protein